MSTRAAVLGLSGIGQNTPVQQLPPRSAVRPKPKRARLEIDGSTNPYLVGKAGISYRADRLKTPLDLTFGDDDVPTLGERWLRRAIELAPPGDEWKPALGAGAANQSQPHHRPEGKNAPARPKLVLWCRTRRSPAFSPT